MRRPRRRSRPAASARRLQRTPLGYLRASGPAARAIAGLGWGLIAISGAACLIVLALSRLCDLASQPPDTGSLGRRATIAAAIRWIATGTGISTVFLLAAAIWTLPHRSGRHRHLDAAAP